VLLYREQVTGNEPLSASVDSSPKTLDTSLVSVCKPLGLIDDLTRFFLPSNKRRSRVSSSATMTGISSYKPVSVKGTAPAVTKHKPKQRWHKRILRGNKLHKHLSSAVRAGKKSKQKSVKVMVNKVDGKLASDNCDVTKSKQRRRRQHRDHVESLIDGLTDYFTAHDERRLKSPALKSISPYTPESHQGATSSHPLDSPTETSKQLLPPSMYSPSFSSSQPRKQKTVEKLFDGLSSFFSVQNEHRRPPASPVTPVSQGTSVRNGAVTPIDGRTNEIKFSQLMNVPSLKDGDRGLKSQQLKGLFDGLSHLYTAHGDRKRKSPFFYMSQPAKSRPPLVFNQQTASPVKQESVATGSDVPGPSAASQTVKVSKEKQQRVPGKLNTNKSLKKSLRPISSVIKKQPSFTGMLFSITLYNSSIALCLNDARAIKLISIT